MVFVRLSQAFNRGYKLLGRNNLKEMAAKNLEEGKKFLTENQKKEGVKTLPSGLQYRVLTEGSGKMLKAKDTVTVNYKVD